MLANSPVNKVVANSGKFPYKQSQYKVKDFIPFP